MTNYSLFLTDMSQPCSISDSDHTTSLQSALTIHFWFSVCILLAFTPSKPAYVLMQPEPFGCNLELIFMFIDISITYNRLQAFAIRLVLTWS